MITSISPACLIPSANASSGSFIFLSLCLFIRSCSRVHPSRFLFFSRFLTISSSNLSTGAVQWVREDVKRLREKGGRLWSLRGADLAVPLYSTLDGTDLRATSRDLVDVLIDLQCTEHVDWLKATEKISRRSQVPLTFR